MDIKAIVRVSFDESLQSESHFFLDRLIEKIFLNQLDLNQETKGNLLMTNHNNTDKEPE